MELATSVVTWRYGCLEARCRCSDVEAWRLELRRRAADLRDVEAWRYGVLEARCSRADVDVFKECWRCAAGMKMCRHRGVQLQTHRGVELRRHSAA